MKLDRRQFVATVGLGTAACCTTAPLHAGRRGEPLDLLLAAHAEVLPERAGAGANHDPMAAEALEAMGEEEAIPEAWRARAKGYAGELPRVARIAAPIDEADVTAALGRADRYGDWLDRFCAEVATTPWRSVVAAWATRLAPGLVGATFHGLLRTAHATRALRRSESAARRHELAAGLAYWAASYTELAVDPQRSDERKRPSRALVALVHPWLDDAADVGFSAVVERLKRAPLASPVVLAERDATPRDELDSLVREAAGAFLEMLVAERQRIWLLHTVTGPAAVELLLPEVDRAGARLLVEHARQAVVALFAAFGAPYVDGAHRRENPGEWPALIAQAAASRSVHTIKLIEALRRFDRGDDLLYRSVAAQWFEWK